MDEDEALDVTITSVTFMTGRLQVSKGKHGTYAEETNGDNWKYQPKELQGSEIILDNASQKQGKGGKMDHACLGLYTISKHLGKGVYNPKNHSWQVIKNKVNVSRLKVATHRVNPEVTQNDYVMEASGDGVEYEARECISTTCLNHPELMRNYSMILVPWGAQWFKEVR